MTAVADNLKDQLARDGVVCIRNVIDRRWCAKMESACYRHAEDSAEHVKRRWGAIDDPPAGHEDIGMALTTGEFDDFALHSPLTEIAKTLLGHGETRYFYDQLFLKLGSRSLNQAAPVHRENPTGWHQDLPYWPMSGNDILSFWVPFRPVPIDAGGLEYLAGSHLSNALYGSSRLTKRLNTAPLPDIEALRETEPDRFFSWDLEPGDCLIHHPRILHHSFPNCSDYDRIAMSVRYIGQDAYYRPEVLDRRWYPEAAGLSPGAPPSNNTYFPVV